MNSTLPRVKTCPYLISLRDPTSFFAYPSAVNGCGRFEEPEMLPGSHQSRFCLSVRHVQCPLAAASWRKPFPPRLRAAADREWGLATPASSQWAWRFLVLAFVALVAGAGLAWWLFGADWGESAAGVPRPEAPLPALQPAPTQVASPTIPGEPMPLPTRTATPGPTDTPGPSATPTAGPALDVPFGDAATYLIHRVQGGDTLYDLALNFGSSLDAIQAANGLGNVPLWVGQLLVIPAGVSDPTGVPVFAVEQVGPTGEALADVAARHGADAEEVRRYNALGDDPWLPPGRWLIVPVPSAR